MTLPRPTESNSAVCAYHDDLMDLIREVRTSQRDILDQLHRLSVDLASHIAVHQERERRAFPWERILASLLSAGAGLVALLLLLQLVEHSTILGQFFGGKVP